MSPPNTPNPAPLVGGNRAKASVEIKNQQDSNEGPSGQLLVARLAAATGRLNRLTDDLAAIADWRDDFAARVRRAQLRFEFVGLDPAEQERLEAEAEVFEAVCRAMSASFARPEAERRAA